MLDLFLSSFNFFAISNCHHLAFAKMALFLMCFFVFTLQFLLCLSVNLCAHEISFCIFIAKCKWVTRKIMCNKILFQAESHSSTYKKRNEEIGDIFFSWEFHKKYYTMIIITSSIVREQFTIRFSSYDIIM